MHSSRFQLALMIVMGTSSLALPLGLQQEGLNSRENFGSKRSFSVPIQRQRRGRSSTERRGGIRRDGASGSVGLGDNSDRLYSVPIQVGSAMTAVQLDTGSSDLWIISDACKTDLCTKSTATRYPQASFVSSGVNVTMQYGDSTSGTFASGPVGKDQATLAGLSVSDQQFVAIDNTTNPTVSFGDAGIFGLGFPSESVVQQSLVNQQFNNPSTNDQFFASISENGPLVSRLASSGQLEDPMFSITLQRDTIDIGGKGQLTLGKLPDGIDNSSVTWVPVRLYTGDDGGLFPPSFAPNETYPFRWEISIDGVYLDGKKMADSTIASQGVNSSSVSALIDTGNSLIRGPKDVVQNILSSVSPAFAANSDQNANGVASVPCAIPHSLAFQIGGKMFPVDPRDFISATAGQSDDTTNCVANNVVAGDAPGKGALFSWNLGDPFLKSNMVAFYYGNLTHPSVDPPRIGFLSTVPANVTQEFAAEIKSASQTGGFESTIQAAPTASVVNAPVTTVSMSSISIPSASPTHAADAKSKSAGSSLTFGGQEMVWGIMTVVLFFYWV